MTTTLHASVLAAPPAPPIPALDRPLGVADLENAFRSFNSSYYANHPFHQLMHEGRLTKRQLQGWVANRLAYQRAIPRKDAAILSNCPVREVRREWIQRILDHDGFKIGSTQDEGGIEAWIRLGVATGLSREEILDLRHVVPGVRFAVDAYVNFARRAPWQEAVCSSLTELFAPEIHKQRLANWPQHYPWIEPTGLQYFRNRVSQARRDVEQGLEITLDYFNTRPLQERALKVLQFKLDVLWSMNDAMALRYGVRM